MEINEKKYKVVTPSEGMWLYNERDNIISDKAYMPDSADVSCWREISEGEKKEIEARLAESEVGDVQE